MKYILVNKIFLLIIIIILFLICFSDSTPSRENEVSIKIEDISLIDESINTTTLSISNVKNLGSFELTISWNPYYVELVNISLGEIDEINYYKNSLNGTINIIGYTLDTINISYVELAYLTFKKNNTNQLINKSTIIIKDSILLTAEPFPTTITHIVEHGTINHPNNNPIDSQVTIQDVELMKNNIKTTSLLLLNIDNLGSCQISITWNSTIASIINVSESDLEFMNYYINNSSGIINIIAYDLDSITSEQVQLVNITFQTNDAAVIGDMTRLNITKSVLLTADPNPLTVNHSVNHGLLSIVDDNDEPMVTVKDVNIVEGGNGSSSIVINNVNDLGSCFISLQWNSSFALIDKVTDGDVDVTHYYLNNKEGSLFLIAFNLLPFSADDIMLVNITFQTNDAVVVGDMTRLNITKSVLLTADPNPLIINHKVYHGMIYINDSPSSDDDVTGINDTKDNSGYNGHTSNYRPIALAKVDKTIGNVGTQFRFDATDSYDSDGEITKYIWDFKDGNIESVDHKSITHMFKSVGIYNVMLTVKDDEGSTDNLNQAIRIEILPGNNPPEYLIVTPQTMKTQKNTEVIFKMNAVDRDSNDTIRYNINWGDNEITTTDFYDNNESIEKTHRWINHGVYTVMITAEDNHHALSQPVSKTICVDVYVIHEIDGWLIDTNSDEIYDRFENKYTNKESDLNYVVKNEYLIDSDDDGTMNYMYNITTETLSKYEQKTTDDSTNAMLLFGGLLLIIVIVVINILYIRKNK